MGLLTLTEVREHVETDLKDTALQRLIDDADAEIIDKAGELSTEIDTKVGDNSANSVFLKRRAESITTVVEEVKSGSEMTETILSSDDYTLRFEGRMLDRLTTGTNPRSTWGDIVTVVYVPKDEAARRIGCLINLVKLAVEYTGLDSEQVGDYQQKQKKLDNEHRAILARLGSWGMA